MLSLFIVFNCSNVLLVGNGFCNDETNTVACNYDGGDCCINFVNKENCSECHCYLEESCKAGFHPYVGDGYCNDETNIEICKYDGNDCCGFCIVTEFCTECVCHNATDILGTSVVPVVEICRLSQPNEYTEGIL